MFAQVKGKSCNCRAHSEVKGEYKLSVKEEQAGEVLTNPPGKKNFIQDVLSVDELVHQHGGEAVPEGIEALMVVNIQGSLVKMMHLASAAECLCGVVFVHPVRRCQAPS